jgi:hypothetical protein
MTGQTDAVVAWHRLPAEGRLMKRKRVRWLSACVLLLATDPANAIVTGSFTSAPFTFYLFPGGAYFGRSDLSTSIDTVLSPAIPPVPQSSSHPIPRTVNKYVYLVQHVTAGNARHSG